MLIGIPKEIKNNENRVALTPAGVQSLVAKGHEVLIETNAGLGSGFTDADYEKQGAKIVATAAEAWAAELVVKVKEPLAAEYGFLVKKGEYHVVLNTDAKAFGGNGLADDGVTHFTNFDPLYEKDGKEWLKLYVPARSAVVLRKK